MEPMLWRLLSEMVTHSAVVTGGGEGLWHVNIVVRCRSK